MGLVDYDVGLDQEEEWVTHFPHGETKKKRINQVSKYIQECMFFPANKNNEAYSFQDKRSLRFPFLSL